MTSDRVNFKQLFLEGGCPIQHIEKCVEIWRTQREATAPLQDFLGLTTQEYAAYCKEGTTALEKLLLAQRRQQKFRIYQLNFADSSATKPFAFLGIEALHKAGYEQPPAADYRLVCDSSICCPENQEEEKVLGRIFDRYNDTLPNDFWGRSLSPSDVVELYDAEKRAYFYTQLAGFVPVRFSPFLAKPMKQGNTETGNGGE